MQRLALEIAQCLGWWIYPRWKLSGSCGGLKTEEALDPDESAGFGGLSPTKTRREEHKSGSSLYHRNRAR